MSEAETVLAIDQWVEQFDPHPQRRNQARARSRQVTVSTDDASGLATLWGRMFAHEDTITNDARSATAQDAALDGDEPVASPGRRLAEMTLGEALTDRRPTGSAATRPGVIIGGSPLPGPVTRRAARNASLTKIVHPVAVPPEPHYRPSRRLTRFVRCRDLT